MKAPQIIILSLMFISLLISAHLHGKDRKPHNFISTAVAVVIEMAILIWGGFFD